jgi:hypothetical protein
MGFGLNSYPQEMTTSKPMERCKPDYETMIANTQKERDHCQKFLNALKELEGMSLDISDSGAIILVGKVYLYSVQLTSRIDKLLKMQEEDKD